MIALIVHTAVQRLSPFYSERLTGKTELLEELANLVISKAAKAGTINHRGRKYTLLGNQTGVQAS